MPCALPTLAPVPSPGARFAPAAIRQASHMLCDGTHPLFGLDLDGVPADAGDLPLPHTSL
ncbi:hypothetical protein [Ideonella aquatica]|uniref:hypothetical protein n=1 Tax=Ideonella aquatica TaxID=2824119 RepID=UPI0035C0817F